MIRIGLRAVQAINTLAQLLNILRSAQLQFSNLRKLPLLIFTLRQQEATAMRHRLPVQYNVLVQVRQPQLMLYLHLYVRIVSANHGVSLTRVDEYRFYLSL